MFPSSEGTEVSESVKTDKDDVMNCIVHVFTITDSRSKCHKKHKTNKGYKNKNIHDKKSIKTNKNKT